MLFVRSDDEVGGDQARSAPAMFAPPICRRSRRNECRPLNQRGVSPETGLYFIGMEFQYALASSTIGGLDQDARYLLRAMARQPNYRRARAPEPAAASH